MPKQFRSNSPNVIHETIEGEVILIDLATGTYYSLRGVGAAVWGAIAEDATEERIEAEVLRRYDGSTADVRSALRRLLEELEQEGLVVADLIDRDESQEALDADAVSEGRLPFEMPSLEKHTDMQDLILLDPVHQVGAEGWPYAPGSDEANV